MEISEQSEGRVLKKKDHFEIQREIGYKTGCSETEYVDQDKPVSVLSGL